MARNNMSIVVQVKDQATSRIKNISDALKELGGVTSSVASKFDALNTSIANSVTKKLGGKGKGGAFSLAGFNEKGILDTYKAQAIAHNKASKQIADDEKLMWANRKAQLKADEKEKERLARKEILQRKLDEKQIAAANSDIKRQKISLLNINDKLSKFNKSQLADIQFYSKASLKPASAAQITAFRSAMAKQKQKQEDDILKIEKDRIKKQEDLERKALKFKSLMNAQYMREYNARAKLDERNRTKKLAEDARKSMVDLTQFNKTMFTTLAFVGMFTKAFNTFANSLQQASELDRVSREYERVFGDTGTLISNIKGFTTTAVDRMEAMRSAISLGQLGIAKDSKEASEIIGMAATAAKMAGKDSSEGVSKVTEALKTGSLSALEFLNEIRSADPALKMYLETLHKAGGALGGAMTAQAKYNLILNTLRAATKDHLKDEADLADIVLEVGQSFGMMRMTIGRLLGTALSPFITKISTAIDSIGEFFNRIRLTDKTLPTFIKNITGLASASALLIATMGTARLLFKGLSSLGIGGLPLLTFGFLTLGQVFSQSGNSLESLLDTFKTFGSVAAGVFQLVQSFIMDPENYAKGIGKMDRTLHEFLQKKGLIHLTETMAKLTATVVKFSIEVGKRLEGFYDKFLEPVITGLGKLFGMTGKGPMARGALGESKDSNKMYNTAVNAAAIGIAVSAGSAIFKSIFRKVPIIGNIFSGDKKGPGGMIASTVAKVPIIGGLLSKAFGERKEGPKGTPDDPIYVSQEAKISDFAKVGNFGDLIDKLGGLKLGVLGTTAAFAGLSVVVTGLLALQRQELETKQKQLDLDAGVKKMGEDISVGFGGTPLAAMPIDPTKNFTFGSVPGGPSSYLTQAQMISQAQVPSPLSTGEMQTLEEDIRSMNKSGSSAELSKLVATLQATQAEKTAMTSVLEDPDKLITLIEAAINKSRVGKTKPAKHVVKSGRC